MKGSERGQAEGAARRQGQETGRTSAQGAAGEKGEPEERARGDSREVLTKFSSPPIE